MSIHAQPVQFSVRGEPLRAQLYLPRGIERPPVLIMAHGFGPERRQCLPGYAWHFADRGMAVLVFEYRGAGEAGSRPRQQVSPRHHLEDYAAALAYARTHPGLDGRRVALWGINLSGGHALVTAARHPDAVRAVVAQSPHVDGAFRSATYPSQLKEGAFWYASLAIVAAALGQPDVGIRVPDRRGPRPRDEAPSPTTDDPRWANSMPARIRIQVHGYRPIREASQIRCPTLVIAPPGDSSAPASALARTVEQIPDGHLVRLDTIPRLAGSGGDFRHLVQLQADFLCAALAIPPLRTARRGRGRPKKPAGRAPGPATAASAAGSRPAALDTPPGGSCPPCGLPDAAA